MSKKPDVPSDRGSVKERLYGMRRSCNACGRGKRKCDGQRPCGRCFRLGGECVYSKRKWHLPPPPQRHELQHQPRRDGMHRRQFQTNSRPDVLGMLPFKRCRWSASPATGLVGMEENGFLRDFFGCAGFLPLTTQSRIRESMVKIMLTPDPRQEPPYGDDRGQGWQLDVVGGELRHALAGDGLPMDPSICMFWCAVAMGALVRGSPFQTVATYTQLATTELAKSYAGPASAEVARAWAMLAYVYGFKGNLAKFQEYLAQAEAHFIASVEQGSADMDQVGFAELINSKEIDCLSPDQGFAELINSKEIGYAAELNSLCARGLSPPQLNGAASEPEVYRYVMQSLHLFEQAVASEVVRRAADRGSSGGTEPTGPVANCPPDAQDLADAMVAAWGKVDFAPLEEVVDRIGEGVGGMLINGTLAVETARTGDVPSTLKRIGGCVDVFERYPGLCRSMMGCHGAHHMLAALTRLDSASARELYERLRNVYNSCAPLGSLLVPPLEEWQGMSLICEHPSCRAAERLFASEHMRAFSIASNGRKSGQGGRGVGEMFLSPGGQSDAELLLVAGIFPDEHGLASAPFVSGNSETWSDPSMSSTSESFPSPSQTVGGRAEWCVEPASASVASTVCGTSPRTYCASGIEHSTEEDSCRHADMARGGICGTGGIGEGVTDPPKTLMMIPQVSQEGGMEAAEENDVGAADWLDVTHALLDVPRAPVHDVRSTT